jgi:sugar lactone lactonase YvrE
MVAPAGHVSVVAGVGTPGSSGDGRLAVNAQLNQPAGLAIDAAGNIFVADSKNHRVRTFRVGGNITTVAGNGIDGFNTDNVPGPSAELALPLGVAVDPQGNLYIADTGNHRIRMVSAANHTITTVAGNGSSGFLGDGGPATGASLFFPTGIAVDSSGDIIISDSGNNRVREFTPGGTILTIAGGGCCGLLGDGGPASAAQLNGPQGLALDSIGNLYIADSANNRIRMLSAQDGTLVTLAGTGVAGNGPGQLFGPQGVASDQRGRLYIADTNNDRIQSITLSQGIVTVGSGPGMPGSTVQLPLSLSLSPGISVDTLGVTLQVSPATAGLITFTAAAGISRPDIVQATADHLVLGWNDDLSLGAQRALSGTILLGTIGISVPAGAASGSAIQISVSQVSGDLTRGDSNSLLAVPLLADLAGSLSVGNCTYLVGDVFPLADPQSNNHCGQFGDNLLTFEDVIQALRLWAFPPPACTDLADALDADPADDTNANPPLPGGDGLPMDLQDLQVIVRRWGNLDPSRPTRQGGSYLRFQSCSPSNLPNLVSRQMRLQSRPLERPAGGTLALGAAEISGGTMRVPVYLRASEPLRGLALAIGWKAPTQIALHFTNGQLAEPDLLDTKSPGFVTAAWLQPLPPVRKDRLLVGYIEWEIAQGIAPGQLRVYRTEALSSRQTTLTLKSDDPNRE